MLLLVLWLGMIAVWSHFVARDASALGYMVFATFIVALGVELWRYESPLRVRISNRTRVSLALLAAASGVIYSVVIM